MKAILRLKKSIMFASITELAVTVLLLPLLCLTVIIWILGFSNRVSASATVNYSALEKTDHIAAPFVKLSARDAVLPDIVIGAVASAASRNGVMDSLGGATYLLPVQRPGRCLQFHPGQFRSWYGQKNGCFVQFWRQWPDGCTHYQVFNTCYQQWDPNIYWTYCVH
jgi:hypothetical protein